jgi:D-beta-D-heptose 7-phosphate kinase/D-beta-D-heptose 1-phosphate adenosyltransferase
LTKIDAVIVSTSELPRLAGRVVMVSGGFDPLHPGHIQYFREAAALGYPLLCNVSNDADVARKHAPLLLEGERIEVIDELACIAYSHLAAGTTAEVLRALRPALFAKGRDWRGCLPPSEIAACGELGVEVRFLDTVTCSSSGVLARYVAAQGLRAPMKYDHQRA